MITREKSKNVPFGIILNWNRYNPLKNIEIMVFLFIANFLSIHIDVFSMKIFRINNIKPCIWLNNHPKSEIIFFSFRIAYYLTSLQILVFYIRFTKKYLTLSDQSWITKSVPYVTNCEKIDWNQFLHILLLVYPQMNHNILFFMLNFHQINLEKLSLLKFSCPA